MPVQSGAGFGKQHTHSRPAYKARSRLRCRATMNWGRNGDAGTRHGGQVPEAAEWDVGRFRETQELLERREDDVIREFGVAAHGGSLPMHTCGALQPSRNHKTTAGLVHAMFKYRLRLSSIYCLVAGTRLVLARFNAILHTMECVFRFSLSATAVARDRKAALMHIRENK